MADSVSDHATDPICLEVFSGGILLDGIYQTESVIVTARTHDLPKAVIKMATGDISSNEFPVLDGSAFVLCDKIEIKAGYQGAGTDTIFAGSVTAARLQVDASGPYLVVECLTSCGRLDPTATGDQANVPPLGKTISGQGEVINVFAGVGTVAQPEITDPVHTLTLGEDILELSLSDRGPSPLPNASPAVGTVTTLGSARFKTGCTVELAGIGRRLSGNAYVSGVEHRFEHGTWRSVCTLGAPA